MGAIRCFRYVDSRPSRFRFRRKSHGLNSAPLTVSLRWLVVRPYFYTSHFCPQFQFQENTNLAEPLRYTRCTLRVATRNFIKEFWRICRGCKLCPYTRLLAVPHFLVCILFISALSTIWVPFANLVLLFCCVSQKLYPWTLEKNTRKRHDPSTTSQFSICCESQMCRATSSLWTTFLP